MTTMNRRTLLVGAGTALAAAALGAAFARGRRGLAPARVFSEGGLAIRGTDPVAYFTRGAPRAGDPALTHDWAGATWAFESAGNRDRFAAEPSAYAPRYGGFCAWAVAAKGQLFSTRPENWAIVDGRLYLNFDDAVQAMWNADRAGFIAEADRRWPEIVAAA